MRKFLPLLLVLGLSCAAGFGADQKSLKKDDAPAEGNAAHKGGSPADKGKSIKKDDAPAPGGEGKGAKTVKPAEKQSK